MEYLEVHTNLQQSKTLGELLRIPSVAAEFKIWMSQYDALLKKLGDVTYKAWASRYCYSLPGLVLELTKSDVVASILTNDFALCPAATLHYTWIHAEKIKNTAEALYRELGWGPPVGLPYDYVGAGAPGIPGPSRFAAGWTQLTSEVEHWAEKLQNAERPEEVALAWNQLCERNALLLCTLIAHRCQRLERLTFGALSAHPDFVYVDDKSTLEGSARLVPLTTLSRHQIEWHLACCRIFAEKAATFEGKNSTFKTYLSDGLPAERSAFWNVRWHASEERFRRSSLRKGSLDDLASTAWDEHSNVGRKFWVTTFIETGADRFLLRMLTGHNRQGHEHQERLQTQIPAAALHALRAILEAQTHALQLKPADLKKLPPCLAHQPFPLPRVVWSQREVIPQGIAAPADLSPRFLTGLSLTDSVRGKLLSGSGPDNVCARLVLVLLVNEGITNPQVLRNSLRPEKNAFREGAETNILHVTLGKNKIAIPLQPLTQIAIKHWEKLKEEEQRPFRDVAEVISEWIKAEFPGFSWPKDAECFRLLCRSVDCWLAHNLPPALNTMAGRSHEVAALHKESLLRLIGSDPLTQACEFTFAYPSPPPQPKYSSLSDVTKAVHACGDKKKALGGEITRARALLKQLKELTPSSPGSPAAAVAAWATREAEKAIERQGFIEMSSLSTYLSNLNKALTSISADEDLRYWDDNCWSAFEAPLHDTTGLEKPEQTLLERRTALQRFARALSECPEYSVPHKLLGGQRRDKTPSLTSAAAVWVDPRDYELARELLKVWLDGRGALLARCLTFLTCLEEHPLRRGELSTLSIHCLTAGRDVLVISPTGFNNLKTVSAKRILPAGESLASSVLATSRLTEGIAPNAKHLFLEHNDEAGSSEPVATFVLMVLSTVIGDARLVLHSTRGSAVSRRLFPGWNLAFTKFMQGEIDAQQLTPVFQYDAERWLHAASAAAYAGHSSRRPIEDAYFSSWTAVRLLALGSALRTSAPRGWILAALDVTPEALRQAKSRAGKAKEEFSEWLWVHQRFLKAHIPPYPTPQKEYPALTEQPKVLRHAASVEARIRYVCRRYYQMDQELAAAIEKLTSVEAHGLEPAVAAIAAQALSRRVKATHGERGRQADLQYLVSGVSELWIGMLRQMDTQLLFAFKSLLIREDLRIRDVDEVASLILKVNRLLPPGLSLLVTFGARHYKPDLQVRLNAAGVRVSAPARDLGSQPEVSVIRAARSTDVDRARLTALARVLTSSFLAIQELKK
ncbi:hypothetical protein IM725_03830 [Ramlibacter aquaticus]|uniref:Tyr recombinase domain-containing protein n=1 Tax=Ramlibacter aquaticus TaxID=2780094 RepID=A0ABR9SBH2_9BURK|nr:hypothetical protein [Ramlibacter aquaticus]MBE7939702.1 hypothetical protein [Ramlibacter aquaticus]